MKHIKVNSNLTFLKHKGKEITYRIVTEVTPDSSGTVEGGGDYKAGSTVTLKAIPNENFEFSHWDDNTTSAERLIIVTQNKTYTATFVGTQTFTVTTNKRGQSGIYYFMIPQTDFKHLGEIRIKCSKITGMDVIYEVPQMYFKTGAEAGKEWTYTGGDFIKKNLVSWDDSTNELVIEDTDGAGMNPFTMLPGEKTLTYVCIATKSPNLLTATDTAVVKIV